jgi:transketolase
VWNARDAGAALEAEWRKRFEAYRRDFAGLAEEFERRMKGELPETWAEQSRALIAALQERGGNVATRKSSQIVLNAFGPCCRN